MTWSMLIAFGSAGFCLAEAFVVLRSESKSVAHAAFAFGMLLLAIEAALDGISFLSRSIEVVATSQAYGLVAKAFLPGTWLLFSLTYARGNAKEFLARWKWVLAVAFLLPLPLLANFPGSWLKAAWLPTDDYLLARGRSGVILDVFFVVTAVFILMNLENTFRSSLGTMRWRIKFMMLGVAELFIFRIYTSSQAVLYSSTTLSVKVQNAVALLVCCVLILRSLFRGKVFNVDIYPSQKLLYASFVLVFAGLYLVSIGALAHLFRLLGKEGGMMPYSFLIIVSLVGLGVLVSSERLRQRTRLFISRNFQRPVHDYRRLWAEFSEKTASLETEVEVSRAVTELVSKTLEVLSATIWLFDPNTQRLSFAASTSLPESKARELMESQNGLGALLREHLTQNPIPVQLDASTAPWAERLKKWNPAAFRHGGGTVLAPLIMKGELVGVLTLSDRVNALKFSLQDFDLLKCVAEHTASELLNIRLGQKLLRAAQMEAFQTVSAFFVHDLKNTVSTLSLTLRNLPVHFDDPEFRKDALRAIGNSVTHLNELIGRLSTLRKEIRLKRAEAQLNEIVQASLTEVQPAITPNLTLNFGEPVRLNIDSEQIRKVVTNLVLNANEALNSDGSIRVETKRQNGWAIFSVSDDGRGMSDEFLKESLFRPFQTTKKNGTGIGMFQSKLIVEAHKGRIEVESQLDAGTTFRVFLPIHA